YTDSEELKKDTDPTTDGVQVRETFQHNQIVVCTTKNIFGIDNPWLGVEKPTPCYDGNGDEAKGKKYRLVQWWEGKYTGLDESLEVIRGWDGSRRWSYKVPPFPWQFTQEMYYQKAYREWRGEECKIIFGKLICIDLRIPGFIDLHSNVWADFYQYIPLGNTVDKAAKVPITNTVNPQPIGKTEISIISPTEILEEPALFFAHTQDVAETSDFLNSSFIPKEGTETSVDYSTTESERDETGQCRVLNVRSNPGDNLFPEVEPDVYQIYANFTIETIPCRGYCRLNKYGEYVNTCEGGATLTLNTETKTPNAQEIFENTTAGSSSTFRRIFPKVEEGAPVSCIANMPAVTTAQYAGFEAQGRRTTPADKSISISVREPDGTTTGGDSKLYFPHIGSVYEYFLKGIQTALRPKGYGEPITNGTECVSAEKGDCSFNMNKINAAIQKAATKYKVPTEVLRAIFEIESAEWINNPASYKCEENSAGAAGVAQITRSAYNVVTCSNERMEDVGMCADYGQKLSRCNIEDAFELMARVLLWKAGKLSGCTPTGGISLSNKMEWYNASCNYYGSFAPDDLTRNYAKEIPPGERRQNGDMNYCDIVCWKVGAC
ncbi:MAG: hypothetical protein AB1744_11930, partial [Candidatus Zixiibacteriota bacterium]